jgi:hypothetical protein
VRLTGLQWEKLVRLRKPDTPTFATFEKPKVIQDPPAHLPDRLDVRLSDVRVTVPTRPDIERCVICEDRKNGTWAITFKTPDGSSTVQYTLSIRARDSSKGPYVTLKYEGLKPKTPDDWSDVKLVTKSKDDTFARVTTHIQHVDDRISKERGEAQKARTNEAKQKHEAKIEELNKHKANANQVLDVLESINRARLHFRLYIMVAQSQVPLIQTKDDNS